LTEGSSLTSRQVVSCLGPLGYQIEVLDPDPFCLVRFSRWVRRVHRCPPAGADPVAYLDFLLQVVAWRAIDVVLPTHEQAWLLAAARPLLPNGMAIALADSEAFARVQSKLAFARLLDGLDVPQPAWRPVERASDLSGLAYPYWLKAPFSTAGRGVREVLDERSRDDALRELLAHGKPIMAQQPAPGQYGQAQGLFDDGRLLAAHTSTQRATGMGGSAAARLSVEHPIARKHLERLGTTLRWHGGLTLDYMHVDGSPLFIECNPRTVEPGNAAASGVNIPDLQVRLSLGETPSRPQVGRAGVRTHGMIAVLMGVAGRGGSRWRLLSEMREAAQRRELYADSAEQLTPIARDPPSLLPLVFVTTRLLLAPAGAKDLAGSVVERYSIGPETIAAAAEAVREQTADGRAPASDQGALRQVTTSSARRGVRSRPGRRLPAAVPGARMQAQLLRTTGREVSRTPADGTLDDLARRRHTLVVTFRRDGAPVATPVWAALAEGRVYVRAERSSGKVKRLRRDQRVLLAPCTTQGRHLGPPMPALGRVLAPQEEHIAERALARRYGTVRALFERAMDVMRVDMCYLELTPDQASSIDRPG
jgi:PPOX class probable F420-dependent enzyme